MAEITCGECGIVFCMPDAVIEQRRRDHKTFYCPNGHSRYYPGKTAEQKKIERLEETVADQTESLDWYAKTLAAERKAHAVTKGKLTRARNRILKMEAAE